MATKAEIRRRISLTRAPQQSPMEPLHSLWPRKPSVPQAARSGKADSKVAEALDYTVLLSGAAVADSEGATVIVRIVGLRKGWT